LFCASLLRFVRDGVSAEQPRVYDRAPMNFRSGFAAIIGLPNVGKSTLLNRLVGQKVAIVSPKPQTTRNRVQGIINLPNAQIVLIDTPGVHRPESALGRQMMEEVQQALEGVDVLILMLDASENIGRGSEHVFRRAQNFRGPRILLLNKVDRIAKPKLLPMIEQCSRKGEFAEIIPISAKTGSGCPRLVDALAKLLPEGLPLFPQDQVTDQPERFLAAEIVREKVIANTYHEVPHAVAVFVERFEEKPGLLRIYAVIHVERDAQKGILIGRGGEMMKKIGSEARRELEEILGVKIYLELTVKIQRNWRDDPARVRQLDWHRQLEELSGQASPGEETGKSQE
jgi:GTP-binding protein Era